MNLSGSLDEKTQMFEIKIIAAYCRFDSLAVFLASGNPACFPSAVLIM